MGIGSGIVADSDPQSELRETLLKGSFLKMVPVDFQLLETLAFRKGTGYVFLNEHLTRIQRSARYFGWVFDLDGVGNSLLRIAEEHIRSELYGDCARVRLLVSENGEVNIEWSPLEILDGPVKLLLARRRTDSNDVFLYHKTTRRELYDQDLHQARKDGYFDVLYQNERGELTECSITNVMLEIDGNWYTPPVSCGLLPGIWRQNSIAQGGVTERVITVGDLANATRIVICNSVRGEIKVGSIMTGNNEKGIQCLWTSGIYLE